MLFIPTIPGEYIVPSIALDSLTILSSWAICTLLNVGFSTYLISSSEESEIINHKTFVSLTMLQNFSCTTYQQSHSCPAGNKISTCEDSKTHDDSLQHCAYKHGYSFRVPENTCRTPSKHRHWFSIAKLSTVFQNQSPEIVYLSYQDTDTVVAHPICISI